MLRKLIEEYMKCGLQIHFGKTKYLTLGLGADIVTETWQIKTYNKLKCLGSILESTGTTTLEIEKKNKRWKKSDWHVKLCIVEQNILHRTKRLRYQALVQRSISLYWQKHGF
jgi:hypothetical protein